MRLNSFNRFNRFMSARRPAWVRLLVGLILALLPIGAALLDGMLGTVLANGLWRPLLLPVAIVFYVWIVSPFVERGQNAVVRGFRPVVQCDDEAFERLVSQYSNASPRGAILAIAIGAGIGFLVGWIGIQGPGVFWLRIYWIITNCLMFGLLGWTIYGSIDATRLTNALHRQPLRFDIFDLRPFEPVGRQSLLLALVFAGGLTLAILLGLSAQNLFQWQTWVIYIPLALIPFLLFFMNMRGTHGVLATEKRRLLAQATGWITALTPQLQGALAANQPYDSLATRYTALSTYEARLQAARTWPYNTAMLRTMAFTIVLPLLGRLVSMLLFG